MREFAREVTRLNARTPFMMQSRVNLMRPDAAGPAELGFRAMELVSRLLPDDDGLESPAA